MAVYEYSCSECNKIINITRSITENDPGYSCETCNSPLIRVYSKIGVTFNGGGFYSTDK